MDWYINGYVLCLTEWKNQSNLVDQAPPCASSSWASKYLSASSTMRRSSTSRPNSMRHTAAPGLPNWTVTISDETMNSLPILHKLTDTSMRSPNVFSNLQFSQSLSNTTIKFLNQLFSRHKSRRMKDVIKCTNASNSLNNVCLVMRSQQSTTMFNQSQQNSVTECYHLQTSVTPSVTFANRGDGLVSVHLMDRIMINDNELYSMGLSHNQNDYNTHTNHNSLQLSPLSLNSDSLQEYDIKGKQWFYGSTQRDNATKMLDNCPIGSFIVRRSTTQQNCFALTLRVPNDYHLTGIAHYLIVMTERQTFKIKGFSKEFQSIECLVIHHSIMKELLPCPLLLPNNQIKTLLNKNYFNCSQNANLNNLNDNSSEDILVDIDSDPNYQKILINFLKRCLYVSNMTREAYGGRLPSKKLRADVMETITILRSLRCLTEMCANCGHNLRKRLEVDDCFWSEKAVDKRESALICARPKVKCWTQPYRVSPPNSHHDFGVFAKFLDKDIEELIVGRNCGERIAIHLDSRHSSRRPLVKHIHGFGIQIVDNRRLEVDDCFWSEKAVDKRESALICARPKVKCWTQPYRVSPPNSHHDFGVFAKFLDKLRSVITAEMLKSSSLAAIVVKGLQYTWIRDILPVDHLSNTSTALAFKLWTIGGIEL
ncbi:unnamed protein product, partial [Medioppia subpectinata]